MSNKEEQQERTANEFYDALEECTPKQLVKLVELLGQDEEHDFGTMPDVVKYYAFNRMMTALDVPSHVWKSRNSKRYKTELYINEERDEIFLVLNKKDEEDRYPLYVRLYDLHKETMLRMIESGAVERRAARRVQSLLQYWEEAEWPLDLPADKEYVLEGLNAAVQHYSEEDCVGVLTKLDSVQNETPFLQKLRKIVTARYRELKGEAAELPKRRYEVTDIFLELMDTSTLDGLRTALEHLNKAPDTPVFRDLREQVERRIKEKETEEHDESKN